MSTIEENIKRILEIKHMTQKELAEKVNLTENYISMCSTGKRDLSIAAFNCVRDVLGVSTSDLFTLTPQREIELLKIQDEIFFDELFSDEKPMCPKEELLSNIKNAHKNIKKFCKMQNISISSLAKMLNMKRSSVNDYLSGNVKCTASFFKSVVKVLNISMTELVLGYPINSSERLLYILFENTPDISEDILIIFYKQNITYKNLADMTGISRTLIYSYLHGERELTFLVFKTILAALNISPNKLKILLRKNASDKILYSLLKSNLNSFIAQNIYMILKETGMNLGTLSQKTEINFSTLWYYFTGKRKISFYAVFTIMNALNVSIEDILLKDVNITHNIRTFCILKGTTLQNLFDKAKISSSSFNNYKNNKCKLKISTLLQISNALELSIDKLILGLPEDKEALVFDTANISRNLKKILEQKDITQKQVAKMTDLDPTTLCSIVNNRTFNINSIVLIAKALNISVEDIIFGTFLKEEQPDKQLLA